MSKKNITQIQRFLILIILILICVILSLLILSKKQTQSVKESNETNINVSLRQSVEESQSFVFKPLEQNLSKVDLGKNDLNETTLTEENLSKNEANLSLFDLNKSVLIEQNLSKDTNLSQDINLSKEQNQSPILKEQNLSQKEKIKPNLTKGQKPKLAIIIDDMASKEQVKNAKALHLKINPSFFPSHTLHPNTPKLAKEFKFYMVHLPLEALYFQNKMPVLSPSDSEEVIEKNIIKIKSEFKDLRFINNHTGSLFTGDEEAMRKLYKVLARHNLIFVDSKTTHDSKAPKIAKEMQKTYIQRDVFLDNEDEVGYIKKQLLSAVKLAHKKGYAIVIGHPKHNTFKALRESKGLLESVELVYLSELYE